jgi:hypothetical protein
MYSSIGNGFAVAGKKGDREVTIGPGYAIDAEGREIVLTQDQVEPVPPARLVETFVMQPAHLAVKRFEALQVGGEQPLAVGWPAKRAAARYFTI